MDDCRDSVICFGHRWHGISFWSLSGKCRPWASGSHRELKSFLLEAKLEGEPLIHGYVVRNKSQGKRPGLPSALCLPTISISLWLKETKHSLEASYLATANCYISQENVGNTLYGRSHNLSQFTNPMRLLAVSHSMQNWILLQRGEEATTSLMQTVAIISSPQELWRCPHQLVEASRVALRFSSPLQLYDWHFQLFLRLCWTFMSSALKGTRVDRELFIASGLCERHKHITSDHFQSLKEGHILKM